MLVEKILVFGRIFGGKVGIQSAVRKLSFAAVYFALITGSLSARAQPGQEQVVAPPGDTHVEPLWAYVPATISPEWGSILKAKGNGREAKAPAPDDLEAWKKMQAAIAQPGDNAAVDTAKAFDVKFTDSKLGGIHVLEVTPAKLVDNTKIVVYTHGGAYAFFSAKSTLASSGLMARATGLKVISIDYTLAPFSKWRHTTDEVVAVFRALLKMGYKMEDIAIYGDSAGGGLAAGSVLKMRDLGMGMPSAVVLWSPWADITETGDTYTTLRDAEPNYTYKNMLGPSALAYADPEDQKNPYVSPVYGDYSKGFPPTLIQGGTKEIFLFNFIRLYQAPDTAGRTVKLDLYEGNMAMAVSCNRSRGKSNIEESKIAFGAINATNVMGFMK